MPKFRTMKLDTPQVATHLLQDPDPYLLPFGNDAPGLPTYKPKNAAPAPTIVDINAACALVGSANAMNQTVVE